MAKRKIIFGDYDTAARGWTLTGCHLSPAEQKTNFVDKSSGDGSWDLTTALTDGIVKYKDRTLTATFETSEGTRASREAIIRHMVNTLDGLRVDIKLPDDDLRHVNGRLHVVREYNDRAHAAVTVTALCDPWKYADNETVVTVTAATGEKTVSLTNPGRLVLTPVIKVEGDNASVRLVYGTASLEVSAGTYQWPELALIPGVVHSVKYSGSGTVTITYRGAVLE